MTIRTMVKALQTEIRETTDLQPHRAAELLNKLSALIGNCCDEIREADAGYAEVLLHYLDTDEAANRAKIRAETSDQYRRKREARDTKELCVELSRSLKYFLKSKADELQLSRHL